MKNSPWFYCKYELCFLHGEYCWAKHAPCPFWMVLLLFCMWVSAMLRTYGQYCIFSLLNIYNHIAGYFQKRNFRTSGKIRTFEKFIFWSSSGFRIIEKSVSHIMCLCLPRTYLLIGMVYDGILTVVGWQSLISGNPALISGNLDEKIWGKKSSMMDQTKAQLASYW